MRAAIATAPREVAFSTIAASLAVAVGFFGAVLAYRIDDRAAPAYLLALVLVPAVIVGVLRRPVLGVAAVFLVIPRGSDSIEVPIPYVGVFIAPALMLTVFGVTTLAVLRRMALGQAPLRWAPPLWWPLALLGWCILSLLSAQDETLAVKQIVVLAGGVLFACIVYSAVETMADVRWILGAYLVVAVYVSVSALSAGVALADQFGGEVVRGRLTGTFSHPNQLGLFAAVAVCFGTGLAFGSRTRPGRIAAALVAGLALVPLLLSLSRGAWIGCGLAFVYFVVALPQARRALLVAAVPLVIVAALVGSFSPSRPEIQVIGARARALTALSPYDERPQIYAEARRQIRANPLLGVGPGNFPYATSRALYADATVSNDHAHNLWLTWAAEVGLPAGALLIAFTVSLARVAHRTSRAVRRRSRQDHAVFTGVVAALVAVLGQGVFDYLLRNVVLFVTVWALIGLLLSCLRINERTDAAAPSDQPDTT